MARRLRAGGPANATIAIVQRYPDKMDIVNNEHLSSATGRYLKNALHRCGIRPSSVWLDYLIPEFPGQRGLQSLEAQDLLMAERGGLYKRLHSLSNLKVVILLGPEVAVEFGITQPFQKVRGFIWESLTSLDIPAVPTYAPSWLYTGKLQEEITFLNDIEKAKDISLNGYRRPKEDFIISPVLDDVRRWRDAFRRNPTRLYVDIEAIGHLNNRDQNEITMVGICRKDTKEVLVVPFRSQGGGYYWKYDESETVRGYVKDILTENYCVFHNAEYDVKHLNYQGLGPVKIGGDTMLLHHALHPELPHSLDYVTSVYGNIPFWKDVLGKGRHQLDIRDETLRTYNARDCVATMQIEEELIYENKEQGTYEIYKEISLGLLEVALEMNKNGLPTDASALATWKSSLRRENDGLLRSMSSLWKIHSAFNWSSGVHMSYLLYGNYPDKYTERTEEYAGYFQEGSKKKKNTKKFKTLQEYVEVFRDTEPFRKLGSLTIKQTDGDKDSTDEEMRIKILEAIVRRLGALKIMKRRREEHHYEEKDLQAMRKVVEALIKYATNEKLLSTYTKLHIEPDGCVHPGFKIHGTKTGRLSSYSPNGQNLPYEAKKIFIAPEGWVFIQFDFSNLELVVLAYVANIKYLINVFKKGLNVHDENTKLFLGIDKAFEHWKMYRSAMKMYVFGRNYGGGLLGMFRRMLTEIPGLTMTYDELKELDENYFRLMPEYRPFVDETTDTLERTRTLKSVFGRIRIFLGPVNAIIRQGLNFRIQSPAADIMGFGLIDLLKEYRIAKEKGLKMRLCLSVHDSAVMLAPKREVLVVLKMLKRAMCKSRRIGSNEISFTGEIVIGPSYQLPDDDALPIDKAIEIYEAIKRQKKNKRRTA